MTKQEHDATWRDMCRPFNLKVRQEILDESWDSFPDCKDSAPIEFVRAIIDSVIKEWIEKRNEMSRNN